MTTSIILRLLQNIDFILVILIFLL